MVAWIYGVSLGVFLYTSKMFCYSVVSLSQVWASRIILRQFDDLDVEGEKQRVLEGLVRCPRSPSGALSRWHLPHWVRSFCSPTKRNIQRKSLGINININIKTNMNINMYRYINSQGGKTGYWLSLLTLVAAGALLNLIPSPQQVLGNISVCCSSTNHFNNESLSTHTSATFKMSDSNYLY